MVELTLAALAVTAFAYTLPETPANGLRGHYNFCRAYASECEVDPGEPASVAWTPALEAVLASVSRRFNERIAQVTDDEHWAAGVDRWDLAEDGRGDCEDIQLAKRRALRAIGLPHRAMRMVVVSNKDQGHAVLAVMTSRGPRILDNLTDRVLSPEQTGYFFIKRESSDRPGEWTQWR